MIVAVLLWVPIKLVKYGLELVIGTEEERNDLAFATNQAIDDYMKEHPL